MNPKTKAWFSLICLLLIFALPLTYLLMAGFPNGIGKLILDHPGQSLAGFVVVATLICYFGLDWFDRLPIEPGRWKKDQANLRKWGSLIFCIFYSGMVVREIRDNWTGHQDARPMHSATISTALGVLLAVYYFWNGFLYKPKQKPAEPAQVAPPPTFD